MKDRVEIYSVNGISDICIVDENKLMTHISHRFLMAYISEFSKLFSHGQMKTLLRFTPS